MLNRLQLAVYINPKVMKKSNNNRYIMTTMAINHTFTDLDCTKDIKCKRNVDSKFTYLQKFLPSH